MSLGLPAETLRLIVQVLTAHQRVTRASVFGSRAKGTAAPGSDVDLAVWGVDRLEAEAICSELDELPSPYTFNVLPYDDIEHEGLRAHVDRVGQPLKAVHDEPI